METCTQCRRKLAPAEAPHVWQDTVVCPLCYAALSLEAAPPAQVVSPVKPRRPVPGYRAISIGASLVYAGGIVNVIAGIAFSTVGLLGLAIRHNVDASILLSISGIGPVIIGLLMCMVAAIAEAVRDIAINSYR